MHSSLILSLSFLATQLNSMDRNLADHYSHKASQCCAYENWRGAELNYREALLLYRRSNSDSSKVSQMVRNLGAVCKLQQHYREAIPYLRESYDIQKAFGIKYANSSNSAWNLATALMQLGNYSESEELYFEAWQYLKVAGPDQKRELVESLGRMYLESGLINDAEKCLMIVFHMHKKANSSRLNIALAAKAMARLLEKKGKLDHAKTLLQFAASCDGLKDVLDHDWGYFFLASGDTESAIKYFNRAMERQKQYQNPLLVSDITFALGQAKILAGNHEAGKKHLQEALEEYKKLLGEDSPRFSRVLVDYSCLIARDQNAVDVQGQMTEAEKKHLPKGVVLFGNDLDELENQAKNTFPR